MAIEEFIGGGRRGFVLIPKGKKKRGWCRFTELLLYLLSSYMSKKSAPPVVV
jgi:hypothetical protein